MTSKYSFSAKRWPGLAKVVEESGELGQILGKILMLDNDDKHLRYFDGRQLRTPLLEELADLQAAISWFLSANMTDKELAFVEARVEEKLELYDEWTRGEER